MVTATKHLRLRNVFATRVREERLKQGLSQESFAEMTGLHRTYIGSIERGERNVSIDNIERIAKALGMKASELITAGSK